MHKIYETMQTKGEIGPFEMRGGQLSPKEFAEYPKLLYLDGPNSVPERRRVVKTLAEEVEVMGGFVREPEKVDPLAEERKKLLAATEEQERKKREHDEEIAKMKAQLAELQAFMANGGKSVQEPPKEAEVVSGEVAKEPKVEPEKPASSKYRSDRLPAAHKPGASA